MITQTLSRPRAPSITEAGQRLMRVMGLESTAPKESDVHAGPDHPVYPICASTRVAAAEPGVGHGITYIPMARGFAYLVAIIDWYPAGCGVAAVQHADTGFCLEALHALTRFGRPTIFNTDQGSQFTAGDFTRALRDRKRLRSAWTARGATSTTSSWSGCGAVAQV